MSLLPISTHSSWDLFLTPQKIKELEYIESQIGDNYTPSSEKVLRFLSVDLSKIKVIILGLDPYPEKERATGRSFEVGGLTSWNQPFRQASLRNIVRLIYKDYNGITQHDEIPTYSYIRGEIVEGRFNILPPDKLFDSLEEQGVLFLNTYFTTEIGVATANSHRDIWNSFSMDLIQYIDKINNTVNWFLWGKEAQSFSHLIGEGNIFTANHPSRVNSKNNDDFLYSDCFLDTMNLVSWVG